MNIFLIEENNVVSLKKLFFFSTLEFLVTLLSVRLDNEVKKVLDLKGQFLISFLHRV